MNMKSIPVNREALRQLEVGFHLVDTSLGIPAPKRLVIRPRDEVDKYFLFFEEGITDSGTDDLTLPDLELALRLRLCQLQDLIPNPTNSPSLTPSEIVMRQAVLIDQISIVQAFLSAIDPGSEHQSLGDNPTT